MPIEIKMQTTIPAWYCARTKPKHEHIAAANQRKNLELEVFFPRLRLEKLTRRGLLRVVEPLFPCYIFVRCVVEGRINEVQHTAGINRLVHFGGKIPQVCDSIIQELQDFFETNETIIVESRLIAGDEVTVASGIFAGMSAQVLKNLSTKKRVQILLEILGRPTTVEVERDAVMLRNNSLVALAPVLAASTRRESLSA